MKTRWILIALFGVTCILSTTANLVAQDNGNSDDAAADAADTAGEDEASPAIDLKFNTRRVTTTNKSLINIVMDASGSMAYKDITDPETGRMLVRGEVVRAAVQGYLAELKPDTTAAGLVLLGHRAYWAKRRTRKPRVEGADEKKSDDIEKPAQGDKTVDVVWQDVLQVPTAGQNASSNDSEYDTTYEIRQSDLGKEQFPDDPKAINPSFDVKQEIEVLAVDGAQMAALGKLVGRVQFESGAPTPLHQAVLEAVKNITVVESDAENRDVVVVTDEFNHLADYESRMKDVRLSQIREALAGGTVRIHWVLFGPEFQPKAGHVELDPYKQQQLSRMKSLAEDFGGSLRIAQTPKQLALAMIPLVNPATKPRLGIVKGRILRNSLPVGARSEFTVELKGADGEPKPAADGKFQFDKVEIGKEYSLIVKGRIRNSTYEKTIEKIAAAPAATAKDVKVELE